MIRRRLLLSSALAATAAIGLAACGDDTDAPDGTGASDGGGEEGPALDAVTVGEDLGAEPEVEFDPPLAVTAPEAELVVAGDGAELADGDTIIVRSTYHDASSGELMQSWWQGAPASSLTISEDAIGAEAHAFLTTATVGSRFVMAGWQQMQGGGTVPLIQVADIDRVVLARAEGEPQEPSGDYPAVTLADDGAPSLDSDPEGPAPDETVRETLILGDGLGEGAETAAGDLLTMHYTGWSLDTGEQFDSSWENGAPFSFVQGEGNVIAGWDENLLGLPIGSQVMLVIPSAEAYGDEGDLAGQTLLFVVDVLDGASPAD